MSKKGHQLLALAAEFDGMTIEEWIIDALREHLRSAVEQIGTEAAEVAAEAMKGGAR